VSGPVGGLNTHLRLIPAPKEEFGRMIFEERNSLGDRTKVQSTTLVEKEIVEVRRV